MTDDSWLPFTPKGEREWMSTKEVADLAGVSQGRVRQLITEKRLLATKLAGTWFIWKPAAEMWAKSERKAGRPPKGETPAGQLELDID